MLFTETELKGAFVIDLERREDNRGFFARTFCQNEFSEHGLKPVIAQANIGFNRLRGSVRGMHFQYPPAAETKLVRCTRGADARRHRRPATRESDVPQPRLGRAHRRQPSRASTSPSGSRHGYQVLEDDTETSYQVGEFYTPEAEGGLRYDDPLLDLTWPLPVTEMSDKDASWPLLAEVEPELRRRMALVPEREPARA